MVQCALKWFDLISELVLCAAATARPFSHAQSPQAPVTRKVFGKSGRGLRGEFISWQRAPQRFVRSVSAQSANVDRGEFIERRLGLTSPGPRCQCPQAVTQTEGLAHNIRWHYR
jgi:hypothetical protein